MTFLGSCTSEEIARERWIVFEEGMLVSNHIRHLNTLYRWTSPGIFEEESILLRLFYLSWKGRVIERRRRGGGRSADFCDLGYFCLFCFLVFEIT